LLTLGIAGAKQTKKIASDLVELLFAHHILNRASQTHQFSYRRQHIARIYSGEAKTTCSTCKILLALTPVADGAFRILSVGLPSLQSETTEEGVCYKEMRVFTLACS
jgi:hypothetical protein